MMFRIKALPKDTFSHLSDMSEEELSAHKARRVIADASPGFPCRVSLQDAAPGEALWLVNHRHLDVVSPYAASHAVYVRMNASEAHPAPGEVPVMLRNRTLSLRAFDRAGFMLCADLVEGSDLEDGLQRILGDPRVAFVDIHFAKPGCYAARAYREQDRAEKEEGRAKEHENSG